MALAVVAIAVAWLYWNRPAHADLAGYVPADCVAFIEANDFTEVANGIERSDAWEALAGPIGARRSLVVNRWLIRLAHWTGIGSADAVLIARAQMAVVFTGASANAADTTLTIKPLGALVIETHTTQRRIRSVMERHLDEFARRSFGQPALVRKQIDGVDLVTWSSADGARHIISAFVGTVVIVGNDETAVLRCADVRRGKLSSLASNQQLAEMRRKVGASGAALFGFIPKAGIKPILQAWILRLAGSTQEATTVTQIFADTFGGLIDGLACSSRFTENGAEDRCFLALSEGVAGKLRSSVVPEDQGLTRNLSFVPSDAYSVSLYHFRDLESFWRDLNALVSSRSDVLAAIAARPLLRSLFKPYGIEDPDSFVRAVGARVETIRLEKNSPSVLVAEAFDRPSLRKLAQKRLGAAFKTESVGDADVMLSTSDSWAAGFADNQFLIGPGEAVRRCLQAKAQSQTLTSADAFRRSLSLIDVSLPITALTFTDDRHAAISFVELFSPHERSAFSTNAAAITDASRSVPYAVSVTILKDEGFEWTARSSFGLLGSLVVTFGPEKTP